MSDMETPQTPGPKQIARAMVCLTWCEDPNGRPYVVADYSQACDDDARGCLHAISNYPAVLVSHEPEMWGDIIEGELT